MAIKQETQRLDPFARAIPGQSFTDEQGLRPYERPPLETDPEKLYDTLDEQLNEETTSKKIADILDVGVSAETLSETLMMKCFTEGVCSPDVAEIVKPFIFMSVVEIGSDHSIKNIVLFNDNEEDDDLSEDDKLRLMQKLNSERFNDTMKESEQFEFDENEENVFRDEMLVSEEDENNSRELQEEEEENMGMMEMPQEQGSFLDMASAEPMPEVENEEELV